MRLFLLPVVVNSIIFIGTLSGNEHLKQKRQITDEEKSKIIEESDFILPSAGALANSSKDYLWGFGVEEIY